MLSNRRGNTQERASNEHPMEGLSHADVPVSSRARSAATCPLTAAETTAGKEEGRFQCPIMRRPEMGKLTAVLLVKNKKGISPKVL